MNITSPSLLLRAHAPDQKPPTDFSFPYTAGLYRLSLIPAGRWPFPTLSQQSLYRCLDPYPAASLQCTYPFSSRRASASPQTAEVRHARYRRYATSTTKLFRGCSHSIMFKLPYLLDPQIAPTTGLYIPRAAGPFTPRRTHAVTHHELWYRYVPESGNWHGGTLTRWIAALSAAPLSLVFGP